MKVKDITFLNEVGVPTAQPGAPTTKSKPIEVNLLTAGPPYPAINTEAVKVLQQQLENAGYTVGNTGIDGKYGTRTAAAVQAFKTDYKMGGDGNSITAAAMSTLAKVSSGQIPKVATPTPVAKPASYSSYNAKPLVTNAVTSGLIGNVLNVIAKYESGGNYNILVGRGNAPLTTMSIKEVLDLQRNMIKSGRESTAVGRYQFIRSTLYGLVTSMGLDLNTKFDEKTQDQLAIETMRRSCSLDRWIAGSISDTVFLGKLSRIWAGLPNPATGASFYAGVGSNKAGASTATVLASLRPAGQQSSNTATA